MQENKAPQISRVQKTSLCSEMIPPTAVGQGTGAGRHPEPLQDASARHEISAMKRLVDGSSWWIMSLATNRDRAADYVDELADKTQQKWRMAWVSEINGQYKNDTSWTEEIIQHLPFFHAYSLRHCNLTEKQTGHSNE